MSQRFLQVKACVSPAEHAALMAEAARRGLSASALLRTVIASLSPHERVPPIARSDREATDGAGLIARAVFSLEHAA